jgi:hypothetical protein
MTVMTTPTTTLYPARQGFANDHRRRHVDRSARRRADPTPDGAPRSRSSVTTYDIEKNADRRICSCRRMAGEPRALTTPDLASTDPAISPDGKRLAFVRRERTQRPDPRHAASMRRRPRS